MVLVCQAPFQCISRSYKWSWSETRSIKLIHASESVFFVAGSYFVALYIPADFQVHLLFYGSICSDYPQTELIKAQHVARSMHGLDRSRSILSP